MKLIDNISVILYYYSVKVLFRNYIEEDLMFILRTLLIASFMFALVSCSSASTDTNDTEVITDNAVTTDNTVSDTAGATDADTAVAPVCGNSKVETGETCDKNTKKCTEVDISKYTSGDAACKATCDGWDVSKCETKSVCGDNVIGGTEVCDGGATDCADIQNGGFSAGFATCKDDCSAWDTAACTICGNSVKEEGELCEAGEEIDCSKIDSTLYKPGKIGCDESCTGWKVSDCKLLDNSIAPYGSITNINIVASNVLDMEQLYKLKNDGTTDREFDANYAIAHLNDVTPDIAGSYENNKKIILTKPSIFTGKTGGKYALVANKGLPPLPENFFTLFTSIAYKMFTLFEEVEMFGPQVVVLFKSTNITVGQYNVGVSGENDVLIAVGEAVEGTPSGSITVDTLCISAVAYGQKKINVTLADNPMKTGGGGKINYNGQNLPLYHPTQTPEGDVSEAVLSYGLKKICPKK